MPIKSWFWIVGGPNGAGETTFCMKFLPALAKDPHYINADLIAAGISPLDPGRDPVFAGRVMLQRVSEMIRKKLSFTVETTLSGKTFLKVAKRLKAKGWNLGLVYVWLDSAKIAQKRVQERVLAGGHDIPPATIERRHARGLAHLPAYLELADRWLIFDNSTERFRLLASSRHGLGKLLFNKPKFGLAI